MASGPLFEEEEEEEEEDIVAAEEETERERGVMRKKKKNSFPFFLFFSHERSFVSLFFFPPFHTPFSAQYSFSDKDVFGHKNERVVFNKREVKKKTATRRRR